MNKPLEFEKPIAELEEQLAEINRKSQQDGVELSEEITLVKAKLQKTKEEVYKNLTPWQRVQIARHTNRPFMLDFLKYSFIDFVELHGDRIVGDDESMPAGLAQLNGQPCVVIGHQKGRDVKENLRRNFGSAHPEGYRKAMRLMRMAEKFKLPVVAFIDTPGAFPGIGAEERNIAEAIAANLRDMMLLKTPIISIIIGEGGSGGALGIGVADRILMLENSYYSVISPEGCAAILWKHRKHAPEAAEAMKLSAIDLKKLELIDRVIPEPFGGAHHDHQVTAINLQEEVSKELKILCAMSIDELLQERYNKFRKFGLWNTDN